MVVEEEEEEEENRWKCLRQMDGVAAEEEME